MKLENMLENLEISSPEITKSCDTHKCYEVYLNFDSDTSPESFKSDIQNKYECFEYGVHYVNDGPIHAISVSRGEYSSWKFVKLAMEEHALEEHLDDNNEEEIPAAFHHILPSKKYVGTWESLLYDDILLKPRLLSFMKTLEKFSANKIDTNIISINKLVLLQEAW